MQSGGAFAVGRLQFAAAMYLMLQFRLTACEHPLPLLELDPISTCMPEWLHARVIEYIIDKMWIATAHDMLLYTAAGLMLQACGLACSSGGEMYCAAPFQPCSLCAQNAD